MPYSQSESKSKGEAQVFNREAGLVPCACIYDARYMKERQSLSFIINHERLMVMTYEHQRTEDRPEYKQMKPQEY
jgi:hypothetical protein